MVEHHKSAPNPTHRTASHWYADCPQSFARQRAARWMLGAADDLWYPTMRKPPHVSIVQRVKQLLLQAQ